MKMRLLIAMVVVSLGSAPALGGEKKKKAEKQKVETGASCKAPAVGTCAACNIVCRPRETAICAPGLVTGDVCHPQPNCRCTR